MKAKPEWLVILMLLAVVVLMLGSAMLGSHEARIEGSADANGSNDLNVRTETLEERTKRLEAELTKINQELASCNQNGARMSLVDVHLSN